MRVFFSSLFLLILLLPAALGLIDAQWQSPGFAAKTSSPGFQWQTLAEPDYYRAWCQFLNDRLSSVGLLTQAKAWLDYQVFGMTDTDQVYVGREGWLFESKTIDDYRKSACGQIDRVRQLMYNLHALTDIIEASGRRLIFSVVPNKATIYPEFVGAVPQAADCGESFYDLLLAENRHNPLNSFLRLDDRLLAAKSGADLLYDKAATSWNQHGAQVAAQPLLKAILGDGLQGQASGDLERALLEPAATAEGQNPSGQAGSRKHLSAAVIYGGPGGSLLLPALARHFDRVDLIAADTIPSANHHENLADYEAIVIMIPESHLADLNLDMDRLCELFAADTLAEHRNSVPLFAFKAESNISLQLSNNQLEIKSLGPQSFFTLPAIPGSDPQTLRILKLEINAPHNDFLVWSLAKGPNHGHQRSLRPGVSALYLTLPPDPSVRLRVNPGRNAGIFQLISAALLEFPHGLVAKPDQAMGSTATYPMPRAPEEAAATAPTPGSQGPGPAQVSSHPSLALNDLQEGRIFQRKGHSADIVVSGTYKGFPEAIEAQVQQFVSHAPVTPWTVIDSAPGDGIFMGILPEVPQGGWYRLAVRFANHPDIIHLGQSRWGVGMLVACIGQSNMQEWFFTGEAAKAHTLLSLHRNGQWMPMEPQGNGAVAFGNRLIGHLGIPVGLLDYAVNGSGLRKEADWGTGYWADRSEDSIYHKFIQGTAAAGGSVEYVIWMQGEADAARGTISEGQYRNTLESFITDQVRKDISNGSSRSQLPFLIVGMVKRPIGRDLPHQAIRDAQAAVAQEIPECYLAATTMDLTNHGHQHLAPEAYTVLGLRLAQTVLYLLGETDYYRGPSVAGAIKADDHTLDIRLIQRGGNDFSPADHISGWEVLQDEKRVPIADVRRYNPNTIRIRLAQPIEGPIRLHYLYGAMPNASRAVHDNSAMELPLEPYVGAVQ